MPRASKKIDIPGCPGVLTDRARPTNEGRGDTRIAAALDNESPTDNLVTNVTQQVRDVRLLLSLISHRPRLRFKPPALILKQLKATMQAPWCFYARVLARNPVREYENLYGGGKLQELFLSDKAGDVMRATLFNTAVDRFHDILEPGVTCSFSAGRLKSTDHVFVIGGLTIEATFDGKAAIIRANGESPL
ncbi:60S acidic ribosomal protein P1 [Phytophthora pseudosyringae]|uniref:60S acidic ribosomal protein P1 n=1 Tax=Phytophthora pseudosyringae TaxID=221518 RepID=A0A8T1WFF5_9STRA|nr:60S acidic ribosomal protein P1 [Phytophthora pseudosyringae]